jgi:hypothetical protein
VGDLTTLPRPHSRFNEREKGDGRGRDRESGRVGRKGKGEEMGRGKGGREKGVARVGGKKGRGDREEGRVNSRFELWPT